MSSYLNLIHYIVFCLYSCVILIASSPSYVNQSPFKPYNSSITLKLHSWKYLHANITHTNTSNYTYFLSLIDYDRVRISYIRKRTKKPKSDVHEERVQVPVTSSLPITRAPYYFVRLMVGTPPREFYFIMDTGSDITWIQCYKCTLCVNQIDQPLYGSPHAPSSTGNILSFWDSRCHLLGGPINDGIGRCMYEVEYASIPQASSRGPFMEESLKVGDLTHRGYAMGCGIQNIGSNGDAAGIFGLDQAPVSFLSQVGFQSFSYCLLGMNSLEQSDLVFGVTIPDEAITGKLVTPPGRTNYYINLRAISVDNVKLHLNPNVFDFNFDDRSGGVVIDSGSAMAIFSHIVIKRFYEAFDKKMAETFGDSFIRHEPAHSTVCYNMENEEPKSRFPRVGFHFGEAKEEKVWLLPFQAVLEETAERNYCLTFLTLPLENAPQIIGNIVQQNTRIYFDMVNKRFGVLSDAC